MTGLTCASRRATIVVLIGLVAALAVPAPALAQSWDSAGAMSLARLSHRATLLEDGRVLVTGGNTAVGNTYDTKLAELYDAVTNTWSDTGSTANGRAGHVAALLPDAKVLVAGGVNANICASDTTAEVFDPDTGTWSSTGSLSTARNFPTATPLPNGKILVAGGGNRCGTVYSSAELYDPTTGTWTLTGSMNGAREFYDAIALADGRVLAVGGAGPSPFPALDTAEVYDPTTGTWTATGSMSTPRLHPVLTLLSDGRVMATGGYSGSASGGFVANGSGVEIWDPTTGVWSATGSLSVARASSTLSLLGDGSVLAVGGTDGSATHASAELWDPSTGAWSATASLTDARNAHTATVLDSGKVLVASGYDGSSCCLTSAELYSADGTAPDISITTPADDASYILGSTVLADYGCTDEPGGSGLASCTGPVTDGAAIDTATIGTKTFTVDAEDNAGNMSSLTHTYFVVYDFTGFFSPVNNPPTLNRLKAGASAPVKFSLDGDQGLGVFATGYPKSRAIACDTSAPIDGIEETMTAGSSSLSYDVTSDEYTYVWKTAKSWGGSCRQLEVRFSDGAVQTALFMFR